MRHYAGYESILPVPVTIHLHALALGVCLLVDHRYRFLILDHEDMTLRTAYIEKLKSSQFAMSSRLAITCMNNVSPQLNAFVD